MTTSVDIRRIREGIYSNDDHEYFSFSIVNQDQKNRQLARFESALTKPLLNKPNDYHMSVVSFNLSGDAIPIFTFKDNTYYVMLSYNGVTYTQPVPYISYSATNTRNIFNYQAFIDMVNQGYLNAYNAMITAQPASAVQMTQAPFLTFTPASLLINLIVNGPGVAWTGIPNDPTTVNIFMNNNLYDLFDAFENYFYDFGIVTFPTAQLIVKDNKNGNVSGTTYTMAENYSTVFKWHDITRIVLTSSRLGVNQQYTMTLSNNGAPVYVPIIASFTPNFASGPDTRGYINYEPQFLIYIDMISSTEIKTIDFQFYYLTKNLTLEPIYLFPNSSVNLLCLFKHKSILS